MSMDRNALDEAVAFLENKNNPAGESSVENPAEDFLESFAEDSGESSEGNA
jgi:hypothetical protein